MKTLHNDILSITSLLRSNRGAVSLLYSIASLLLVTFVGSALLNSARHETVASADFGDIAAAQICAESGVQCVAADMTDRPAAVLTALNKYRDGSYGGADKGWIIGGADSWQYLSAKQKFNARIVGFDGATQCMQVEVIGVVTGAGRKVVNCMYRLENVTFPTPSSGPRNALYLGGGNNGMTSCCLNVVGSVFARAPFSTGSANIGMYVNGNFQLSDTLMSGVLDPDTLVGLKVDSAAYFGRPVRFKTNFSYFGGKTFFNRGITSFGNVRVTALGDIYANANVSGGTSDWNGFYMNGTNKAYGVSGCSYAGFFRGGAVAVAPLLQGNSYDPVTAIGMSGRVDPPAVNIDLSAALPLAYTGGRVSNATIQSYYTQSGTDNKRYNGTCAVINATGWNSNSAVGITGKAIVNITSFASGSGDGKASSALMTSGATANVLVCIDIGAGNTGILDLGKPFRGVIYIKSGNPTIRFNGGTGTGMQGCIYAAAGTRPLLGGNGGGTATLTWDSTAVNEFNDLGVFATGGVQTSGTMTGFDGATLCALRY